VLAQLGADKGLANYNREDDLETLLKNVVNANKYLLSDVDEMVYKLPAVGGTLGPRTCLVSWGLCNAQSLYSRVRYQMHTG
jgi:hypothetical protein